MQILECSKNSSRCNCITRRRRRCKSKTNWDVTASVSLKWHLIVIYPHKWIAFAVEQVGILVSVSLFIANSGNIRICPFLSVFPLELRTLQSLVSLCVCRCVCITQVVHYGCGEDWLALVHGCIQQLPSISLCVSEKYFWRERERNLHFNSISGVVYFVAPFAIGTIEQKYKSYQNPRQQLCHVSHQ